MKHSAELKRCLEQCDIAAIRRLSAHIWPHLPAPKTDGEALATIHYARTQMKSISLKLRFYSHCWLRDRNFPSALPDYLKSKAERMYPRIVGVVGISVGSSSVIGKAVAPMIERSMSDAVMECYSENKTEPVFVKTRMFEAKNKTIKKLIGRLP